MDFEQLMNNLRAAARKRANRSVETSEAELIYIRLLNDRAIQYLKALLKTQFIAPALMLTSDDIGSLVHQIYEDGGAIKPLTAKTIDKAVEDYANRLNLFKHHVNVMRGVIDATERMLDNQTIWLGSLQLCIKNMDEVHKHLEQIDGE